MAQIIATVFAYLLFNVAVWAALGRGGLIALAAANALGALVTGIVYRKQLVGRPKWLVSLLGSFGILAIVLGLRGSHAHLPVSLSIEAVYNGFACLSWPLFVLLNRFWPQSFTERPNRFDLLCHFMMAAMVALRFGTYGEVSFDLVGLAWIALAIAGYVTFNISIKLGKGHRPTNIAMNFGGALLLVLMAVCGEGFPASPDLSLAAGALLGGLAIFGIVKYLGESYVHFGKMNKASLVAPLVYDGLLIASPTVMLVTGESISPWTLAVAVGMCAITVARYRHHTAMA